MIPVKCECGKSLRVKDEFAGKKTRCPECKEIIRIPQLEQEEDELEDWDEEDAEMEATPPPKSSRSSKKPTKKKKSSKSSSGGSSATKKVFGGLSILLGVAILGFIVYAAVIGEFRPKRLGGLILPFAMIGMGTAWIRGETYGE